MIYTGDSEAWGAYFIYALLYYQKQEQDQFPTLLLCTNSIIETSVIDFALIIFFIYKNSKGG